jgi:hypothetical protein
MAIAGTIRPRIAEPAVVLGAGSSLALPFLFFRPWLVLGLVVDAVLLCAVAGAAWTPSTL